MTSLQFFLTTLALAILNLAAFYLFFNPGTPSMAKFKQAGTPTKVNEILRQWGEAGLTKARRNLAVDWIFILIYSTMWIAAARYFEPRVGTSANVFAAIGLLGAIADVIENACLASMLKGNPSDATTKLCKRAMPINLTLFGIAGLYFFIIAPFVAARA